MRERANPAVPTYLAPTWTCVGTCVCVCALVKVSPPRSLLGGGRAHFCTRNKMTHCRGHSRTAPPGTCRSRDRGQERHQSRQPPRTGCGCYTCRGKTESWENNGLEPWGLQGQERNGHLQTGKDPWALLSVLSFPPDRFLVLSPSMASSSGLDLGHHPMNCFPRHPLSLPSYLRITGAIASLVFSLN